MTNSSKITFGRTIARNSIYNLLGQGLPILVAVVSMPILVQSLGVERLGVLTIAWMFIGYFSIFDFGLGRALTKLVAEKIGKKKKGDIPALISTALVLMGGVGLLGGVVLAVIARYITYNILHIPESLQQETQYSLYCIAFSIPIITTTSGLRGVLEANQLFKGINIIRFLLGTATYVAPVAICLFSKNVFLIIITLVIARLVTWVAHVFLCVKVYPVLRKKITFRKSHIGPLLSFGGWMTAVNLCFPMLVYIERLFIGAFLPVAFLAYYTTPYDMATKLWILPGALTGTLLPVFSTTSALSSEATGSLYQRVLRYILLFLFPICITIIAFSKEILLLWLGIEFSENSTVVLQMITIGVFLNSFAQVAFVLMQSYGRPDLSAKILFIQIPLYIPLLIILIKSYGINGAAMAWLLRVIVDSAIFITLSFKLAKIPEYFRKAVLKIFCVIILVFSLLLMKFTISSRTIIYSLSMLYFIYISWNFLVTDDEILKVKIRLLNCVNNFRWI
jgi:O-antigen/teichoic acid export membrane protein